jgi:hypothetical protein
MTPQRAYCSSLERIQTLLSIQREADLSSSSAQLKPHLALSLTGRSSEPRVAWWATVFERMARHPSIGPLLCAISLESRMDLGAVQLLLDSGADPNVVDNDGMSLVQHALRIGSIDLVAALLSKGVNPNTADSTGATPVHAAALWSDASAMRLLLEHGAELELRDQFGNTPLHVAARASNKEVVRLLLERGAPVNARNKRNQTPLDLTLADFTTYRIIPGRGLEEPTMPGGAPRPREPRPMASSATEIAELLIQHGAEGSGTNASPQSSSPTAPSENPGPVVDPRSLPLR